MQFIILNILLQIASKGDSVSLPLFYLHGTACHEDTLEPNIISGPAARRMWNMYSKSHSFLTYFLMLIKMDCCTNNSILSPPVSTRITCHLQIRVHSWNRTGFRIVQLAKWGRYKGSLMYFKLKHFGKWEDIKALAKIKQPMYKPTS